MTRPFTPAQEARIRKIIVEVAAEAERQGELRALAASTGGHIAYVPGLMAAKREAVGVSEAELTAPYETAASADRIAGRLDTFEADAAAAWRGWTDTIDQLYHERLRAQAWLPVWRDDKGLDLSERALQRLTVAVRRAVFVERNTVKRQSTELVNVLQTVRRLLASDDGRGLGYAFQRPYLAALTQDYDCEVCDASIYVSNIGCVGFDGPLDRRAECTVRLILRFITHFKFSSRRCGDLRENRVVGGVDDASDDSTLIREGRPDWSTDRFEIELAPWDGPTFPGARQ